MIKRKFSVLVGLLVVLGLVQLFIFSAEEKGSEDKEYQQAFNQDYRIYTLNIPADLEFCGEQIPVHDIDVRERLDRELLVNTYWQSNSLLYIKRSKKWFPIIEPILAANGIPDDFKYLALIESGLTNVVSPSGATGFWQLMKETGKEFGLEVNKEVDERYNLALATEAACKYLKEGYGRYGNWTLTAASYNMGMNGVDRQLKRQQADNYYDLLLNAETSRYVFRIIAAKEILTNTTKYGFRFREKDLYPTPQIRSIKVDTTISNLVAFAKDNEVSYKILKIFNPWLRQTNLPNSSGKQYSLDFPTVGYFNHHSNGQELNPAFVDSLESIADSVVVYPTDTLIAEPSSENE